MQTYSSLCSLKQVGLNGSLKRAGNSALIWCIQSSFQSCHFLLGGTYFWRSVIILEELLVPPEDQKFWYMTDRGSWKENSFKNDMSFRTLPSKVRFGLFVVLRSLTPSLINYIKHHMEFCSIENPNTCQCCWINCTLKTKQNMHCK